MGLAKFEIKSFSDNLFKKDGGKKDFQIPINPESFTRNLKVERDTTKGSGNNHTNSPYCDSMYFPQKNGHGNFVNC